MPNYVFKNDKIFIEANDGCNYRELHQGKRARIILPKLDVLVFECEYNRKPRAYRPGKWEKYILSMSEEARKHLFNRNISQQINAQRIQQSKFEPIDDGFLF